MTDACLWLSILHLLAYVSANVLAAVVAASGLLAESVVLMALEVPSDKLVVKWLSYFFILGSFPLPLILFPPILSYSSLSYFLIQAVVTAF